MDCPFSWCAQRTPEAQSGQACKQRCGRPLMQLMSAKSASATGLCRGYPGHHLSASGSVETLRYSVLRGDGRVDGFLSPRGFFSRSACAEAMTSRSSEPEQSQSSPIVCVAPPIGSATPRTTPRSPRPRRQQIRKSDETEIGVTSATMLRSSCSGMASGDPITYASPQRNRRSLRMVAVEASAWT